jgi:phosphate transport system substrate-binding protein
MILIARGLSKQESTIFESSLGYRPQFAVLAYDAVAVIVNHASADSVFTMNDLKDILSGKSKKIAVMDGRNATSTVRFLKDSILRGAAFGANVVASKNSDDVVDIVSKNENVVGFVGLSWVGDSYDPKQQENLKKIRLALVECVRCVEKGLFAKPSQATISYAQYPLPRPLYYILKENSAGLGTGFMNFMSLERGQLIFKRALLVPAKMNFKVRSGKIKESD